MAEKEGEREERRDKANTIEGKRKRQPLLLFIYLFIFFFIDADSALCGACRAGSIYMRGIIKERKMKTKEETRKRKYRREKRIVCWMSEFYMIKCIF